MNKITIGLPAILLLALAGPVYGSTYTVTKTTDTNDGSCSASDCSLREAITAANSNAGADTVSLSTGTYTMSLVGISENSNATGDYDITDTSGATTISGGGLASSYINAADLDRIFHIQSGASLVITNTTITNGSVNGDDELFGGGAIACIDGSFTSSNVTISASVVTGTVYGRGGGIYAGSCNLSVSNSVVTSNTSTMHGGGMYISWSSGDTIAISNSVISSNTASSGGEGGGGGIYLTGGTGVSTVTLSGLTISNNTSTPDNNGYGSGLYINGPVNTTNATIYGNSAYNGGGVYITDANYVNAKIAHTTITNNSATNQGGGVYNESNASGSETIKNSIIANNTAVSSGPNCIAEGSEVITSGDYNIIASNSGCSTWSAGAHDQINTDPLMASAGLADNGGDTNTVALQPTSPAKDAIPSASCTDAASAALTTDQRGFTRPENSNCDIGAYELDQTDPTVTATAGDDSIECAAETWTNAGATVTDNADSLFDTLTAASAGTVTVGTVGSYNITYTATDHDSNAGTAVRTVTVADATVPTISLIGEAVVSLNQGETYTDAGATATDVCDTSVSVTTTGSVDSATAGTYTLTYNAADDTGNAATAKTRTITVVAGVVDETPGDEDDSDAPDDYENEDPTDQDTVEASIMAVTGLTQGKIKVTYTDNTEYIYTVFNNAATGKKTKIKQINGTAYYAVLQALGKKLAVVNVLNGEVLSRKAFGQKKYQQNSLKLFTLRKKITAVATSKNNKNIVRLAIIKINSDYTLGKKDTATLTSKKVKVTKTKQKNNSLLLKSAKGEIIQKYLVTKRFKLKKT